ncbi:MAG: serine/threonine-protein kinase [Pseudomonadota bacterium]|nr:serine/threonine-protein kinase [Pseudomonadota bacterium]
MTTPADTPPLFSAHALPPGTRLAEFELRDVLGEGGFAIVYRAWDESLRRIVAIKEFMPGSLATRTPDGRMMAREARLQDSLAHGLQSFLSEARLLAQFDHPALIRVYRFWEQNGTGYMAMQLCQGRTLRALRQAEPRMVASEAWLKHMLSPILDALELLHASQCYHRDISPDNIMILDSGVPMLLDFGAARQALGDATQALTVIVKPGYAPIEQYDSVLAQGPWTDIYSLGAVLYYLVTGKPLTASVARLLRDPLPKLADMPDLGISPAFAHAIDRALTVHPDERIRSVAEFREALALPTFWADMQRQSVELGALRSQSGVSSSFAPLPGDERTRMELEPVLTHAERTQMLPPRGLSATQPQPTTAQRRKQRKSRPATAPAATAASRTAMGWLQRIHRLDRRALPALAAAGVAVITAAMAFWPAANTPPAPEPVAPATPSPPPAAATPAPPPAAATAVAGAQLLLDVLPWGVVYVNGQMQGLSPPLKQLWLSPGTYTVEVRNAGLPTHTRTITIQNGQDVQVHHEFR